MEKKIKCEHCGFYHKRPNDEMEHLGMIKVYASIGNSYKQVPKFYCQNCVRRIVEEFIKNSFIIFPKEETLQGKNKAK